MFVTYSLFFQLFTKNSISDFDSRLLLSTLTLDSYSTQFSTTNRVKEIGKISRMKKDVAYFTE